MGRATLAQGGQKSDSGFWKKLGFGIFLSKKSDKTNIVIMGNTCIVWYIQLKSWEYSFWLECQLTNYLENRLKSSLPCQKFSVSIFGLFFNDLEHICAF